MSDDVVNIEVGLGVHWHGDVGADGRWFFWQEISPGKCILCAYWPEPPPNAVVTEVNHETGVITITALPR